MNKKSEITLPAVHCIYVIKFQLPSEKKFWREEILAGRTFGGFGGT